MVSSFHNIDSNLKLNAYGQIPDSSTDPSAGTNPSDNYTDAGISTPSDNLTNPDNMTDSLSPTGSSVSNDATADNNNTSSQGVSSTTVPEFGSLVPVILIVATFTIIILNRVR